MSRTVNIFDFRLSGGARVYETSSSYRIGENQARRGTHSGVTRVVLADDHPSVRTGIRILLERTPDIQVVGEASDGREALTLAQTLLPDVLVLDLEMPVLNGKQVVERIREMNLPVRVLVLSAHDDRQYILGMFESGASGYLVKDEAPRSLARAIRKVATGQHKWLSRRTAERVGFSLPADRNIPH